SLRQPAQVKAIIFFLRATFPGNLYRGRGRDGAVVAIGHDSPARFLSPDDEQKSFVIHARPQMVIEGEDSPRGAGWVVIRLGARGRRPCCAMAGPTPSRRADGERPRLGRAPAPHRSGRATAAGPHPRAPWG